MGLNPFGSENGSVTKSIISGFAKGYVAGTLVKAACDAAIKASEERDAREEAKRIEAEREFAQKILEQKKRNSIKEAEKSKPVAPKTQVVNGTPVDRKEIEKLFGKDVLRIIDEFVINSEKEEP